MKKVALLAAVVGMFTVTSCRKAYTCECTGDQVSNLEIPKSTKSEAETICSTHESNEKLISDPAASCSVK